MSETETPTTGSSIIDNRGDNTLLASIKAMSGGGRELWVATAFFSLDALVLLADAVDEFERVRLLFGDDASPRERAELLTKLQMVSDPDLLKQREQEALLTPLKRVEKAFVEGRVEARCYTKQKFHAKAYVFQRPEVFPTRLGIIGSGNFTRPGLTKNIELNVQLNPEQTAHLEGWFNERWDEAAADVVTKDLLDEVRRHITLYDPYIIYLKALSVWGQYAAGPKPPGELAMFDKLDPHQQHACNQALAILDRGDGVMLCDGVGLGKSYIALALMERLCRSGSNVLLIAPKNILLSTWEPLLREHLAVYQKEFGDIHAIAMTSLGFPPSGEEAEEGPVSARVRENRDMVERLQARASAVVIDESHNFRSTSASRYQNLQAIVKPSSGQRKKVILLTATPVNNAYRDIGAQLTLMTQGGGRIAGYPGAQIMGFVNALDRANAGDVDSAPVQGVLSLFSQQDTAPATGLRSVLEQVVIQRSRKTCKEQSEAAGRPIHFPRRLGPEVVEYEIGASAPEVRQAIRAAEKRFRPLSYLLQQMNKALAEITDQEKPGLSLETLLSQTRTDYKGIKLAAFLPEQYRMHAGTDEKTYQTEVRLAGLVYSNTLKQLESSLPAFQSILQSIAEGLIARLEYLMPDDARALTDEHKGWICTPIFGRDEEDTGDDEETESDEVVDGENLAVSGDETDEWIENAIRKRGLRRKLERYADGNFDLHRWRRDIEQDLAYLREIHQAVLEARRHPDPKLQRFLPLIRQRLERGEKVLVFTQSQRSAEYLEQELRSSLGDWKIARIDSRVSETRQAILHAFCPGYNPKPDSPHRSVPASLDVLISTDILSEGVNLQQAGAIFNWDIHWNPVRLIQRIGRVDRRLDPAISPLDHSFAIYNVLPPPEINDVIRLIDRVEGKTLSISKVVGVDMAFFQPDDPAGTLQEFNAAYEGGASDRDDAMTAFIRMTAEPPERWMPTVNALPPGAFGVWDTAGFDGLFALFTMEATEKVTDADREKYAGVVGQPVLAIAKDPAPEFDAGGVLRVLGGTVEGEPSGTPGDEAELGPRLKRLRTLALQQFAPMGLPGSIRPQLVCWMQMKKGA